MAGALSRIAVSMAAAVAGGTTWMVVEPGARTVVADFIGFQVGPATTATTDMAANATRAATPGASAETHHPDARPSFNCTDAQSTIEHLICSDPSIAEADRVLAKVWSALGREDQINDDLRAEQRQWLNRRDACLIDDDPRACVRQTMLDRISILSEF